MRDPREQLLAEIQALAHAALEVAPGVATVLYTLAGAMVEYEEDELAEHTCVFSKKAIIRIQAKKFNR